MTMVTFRQAGVEDATAVHGLISDNLESGHLLPRTLDDIVAHAPRFVVAESDGKVVGCAELAPLSKTVAEVRSLVVDQQLRGRQIGPRLVTELAAGAGPRGFATLCAFTHQPSHFVKMGFTIVPHMWVPEKIAHDCTSCPLFRRCGQYAVTLPLRAGVHVRPEQSAAVIYGGRNVAARRPNVERLQLPSSGVEESGTPGARFARAEGEEVPEPVTA
jgi:amino-acid N-acetyltransferase